MKNLFLLGVIFLLSAAAFAQPRPPETARERSEADIKPAPESFDARYEGGFFGFSDKQSGRLRFDDANSRFVFFGKDGKEMFGIPYASVLVVSPQSRSVTTPAGSVVRHIPLPGAGLAGFIREKRRYLIVQFHDPDVDARGTVSFKIDDRDLLDSAIRSLGEKSGLKRRGDAYIRPQTNDSPGN